MKRLNRRDAKKLLFCDAVAVLLLVEYLCGYELAIWSLIIWLVISAGIHFDILRDYI